MNQIEWRHFDDGTKAGVEVSNTGEVRRRINETHPERKKDWCVYKQYNDKDGYKYLRLNGRKWLTHRLVYTIFVGELQPGLVVAHRNGDNTDNRPENLVQCTQAENIRHKYEHGTILSGENNPQSKNTREAISRLKEILKTVRRRPNGHLAKGEAPRVARLSGVSLWVVYDVARGKGWKNA